MPTSAERLLLDTSAALAWVDREHVFHTGVNAAAISAERGLAGHARFEAYSVLTRQPPPKRLAPASAVRLLDGEFPRSVTLSVAATQRLLAELADLRIAGGAVYDALVAAAAREASLPLLSCDERAVRTYRALDVTFRLVTA